MKLIVIIILAFCVFPITAQQLTFSETKQIWHRFLLKHIDECVKESGVDRVLAKRLLPYGEYVDDPKLKCFVKCIALKLEMVEEDTTTKQNNYLDILNIHDPKIRTQIISQCFEKFNEEDECAQVFKTSECVYFTVKKALTGKAKDEKIRNRKAEL